MYIIISARVCKTAECFLGSLKYTAVLPDIFFFFDYTSRAESSTRRNTMTWLKLRLWTGLGAAAAYFLGSSFLGSTEPRCGGPPG